MFRIFSKLRLHFLSEGKAKNYFYYACGEIFLIVVGILIALQLNNWNESRKDQQRLASTLVSLADDLRFNQQQFTTLQDFHVEFLGAAELLFNVHLNGQTSIESDNALMKAFRLASYFPPLTFADSAYQTLQANNRFEKLHSPELKSMLAEYFRRISWLVAQQPFAKSFVRSVDNDIYHYTITTPGGDSNVLHRSTAGLARDKDGTGEDDFTLTYDLEAFRADNALNGKLYDLIDMHKDRIGMLKGLKLLTEKMLPLIQAEIDTL